MQLYHENLIEISMISNFSKMLKLKNVTWYREMDIIFGISDPQLSKISWKILDNFQKNFFVTQWNNLIVDSFYLLALYREDRLQAFCK